MSKIDRLNQLISEADEAYKQKIINILDEVVPGIDIEARAEISKKICWDKHGFIDSDEIILMHDGRAFDNSALADVLTDRIQKTRALNKEL